SRWSARTVAGTRRPGSPAWPAEPGPRHEARVFRAGHPGRTKPTLAEVLSTRPHSPRPQKTFFIAAEADAGLQKPMSSDAGGAERYRCSMDRVSIVNDALDELSKRLIIPCDIIAVHREDGLRLGGRERKWTSLRYGAFLLSYAPLEGF